MDAKSIAMMKAIAASSAKDSGGGVQPDWNENDSGNAAYIRNKPFYEIPHPAVKALTVREAADSNTKFVIPTVFEDMSGNMVKIMDYTACKNDLERLIFVTEYVNDDGEPERVVLELGKMIIEELGSVENVVTVQFGDGLLIDVAEFYLFCAPAPGIYTGEYLDQTVELNVPETGTYTNWYETAGFDTSMMSDGEDAWFELSDRTVIKTLDEKFLPDAGPIKLDFNEIGLSFLSLIDGTHDITADTTSKAIQAYKTNRPFLLH